jgi:FtsH-binding integral membrane protein
METRNARAIAALADVLCLGLFVALGRESHDINSGIAWYLTVLWPFLVGWFAVALTLRLYASASNRWLMLAYTWAGGIAIALVLRAVITHRDTPLAFIIVAYAFLGFATFGWRLAALGVARLRGRPQT